MKRDEVRQILGEAATDEMVDAIMKLNGDAVNAEKAKAKTLQQRLDDTSEQLAAKVAEADEKAKASMSIEERMKAMEESYAAKEAELAREQNKLAAEKIFSQAGISEEEYSPLMATVVTSDAEATAANANAIAALVASQKAATETATRQALLKEFPSPDGANAGKAGITKEAFDAMSYSERVALYNESPEVYQELNS